MNNGVTIRRAKPSDADAVRKLYGDTIRAINSKDYDEEQIKVWSAFEKDAEPWLKRISKQNFIVAEINHEIAGFASLTNDGYLDYMFVHKDHQRKGVARRLLKELESFAEFLGLSSVWARVSITARPFFAKHGFEITKRYTTKVDNVEFDDCEMTKVFRRDLNNVEVMEIEFGSEDYLKEIDIRNRILRIPLGLDIANDDRSREDSDHHLGAYEDGKLVGVLVLTPLGNGTVKMRQVAVDEACQGRGIGKLLVDRSEIFSMEKGYGKIEMHARDVAVPFYEKLGYIIEGEMFTEVTIPHYKLYKYLNDNKESSSG